MPVTLQTFEQLALEDPEGNWELFDGQPRRKPAMTFAHGDVMAELGFALRRQLDRARYRVHVNHGRARTPAGGYLIPDVIVIPAAAADRLRGTTALEVYDEPLPLVVEVWSPSTGDYDVATKIPGYQQRGDAEIWLLHPYEHWLHAWRRQPDGTYAEERVVHGEVRPIALPRVVISLEALFPA